MANSRDKLRAENRQLRKKNVFLEASMYDYEVQALRAKRELQKEKDEKNHR